MSKFSEWMLRTMGLKRLKRVYHVNLRMAEQLESMAVQQNGDAEKIAVGFIAEGIARYQKIDEAMELWRRLSPRQREVVALVCLGYTNKEIAVKLGVTPQTIKTHVSASLDKFELINRGEIQRALMEWDFSEWDR